MPSGCLPIFGKSSRRRYSEEADEFDDRIVSTSSKSSIGFIGLILRKDSALTIGSVRSNSSTLSSASTRCSVSFNPKVQEVFFDKSEAPSHVRSLMATPARCPSAGAPIYPRRGRVLASSPQANASSVRRVERRHLVSDKLSPNVLVPT